MVSPDLSGFAQAQTRLRQELGQDVAFYGPVTMTFPANTPIDPETGRPYDPTIQPTASGRASGIVRCSVARIVGGALRGGARQTKDTAAGIGDVTHVTLIADDTPTNRAIIQPAESFRVIGSAAFKVQRVKLDAPVRGADRIVVFGKVT